MTTGRRTTLCFLLLRLCLALLALPAGADDWPQFRRDSSRTAVSTDRVRLPVTPVWTWTAREMPPHCTVWRGRVFFVDNSLRQVQLLCLDARTGVVLWRQPLNPDPDGPGKVDRVPSILLSGLVVVREFEWIVEERKELRFKEGFLNGDRRRRVRIPEEVVIREPRRALGWKFFEALTGREVEFLKLDTPLQHPESPVAGVYLADVPPGWARNVKPEGPFS